MSYTLTSGDVVRVQIATYDTVQDQLGLNAFYWQINSIAGGTLTDLQLLGFFAAQAMAYWQKLQHFNAIQVGASVQDVTPLIRPIPAYYINPLIANPGTNGAPLPDQVSGLVGCRGQLAQKGQNVRIYVPFPGTLGLNSITGNTTTAYLIGLGSIATMAFGDLGISSGLLSFAINPVIYHRAQKARLSKSKRHPGGTLPATGQAIYALSQPPYAEAAWANQKRRSQRRRQNPLPIY